MVRAAAEGVGGWNISVLCVSVDADCGRGGGVSECGRTVVLPGWVVIWWVGVRGIAWTERMKVVAAGGACVSRVERGVAEVVVSSVVGE